jgi:predicted RNA binding protein with dsRBD fold (UPF0201 family)
MPEIRVSAYCYPTEDKERVVRAIRSIFPDASVEGEDLLTAQATSVDALKELLKRQRIRDAARKIMRRNMQGTTTSFRLNKQVAAVGKVSFSEEAHPLGDIEVTITDHDLERLIDDMAPNTRQEDKR